MGGYMKKKRNYKKQPPLWKNIALLLLSLLLLGASVSLVATLNNRSGHSFDNVHAGFKGAFSHERENVTEPEPIETKSASASGYGYFFYDFLMKNSPEQSDQTLPSR